MVCLVLVALALAGCGGGGATGGTTTGTPVKGGVLRVADVAEAITLNPFTVLDNNSVHVFAQILEPLYRTTSDGKVVPWLVTDAKPSADYKTWTFKLREGVKFSDGKPMTADDVVYSLDQIRTSANWKSLYAPITSVKVTSPSTVVVRSKTPFPTIETVLSLPLCVVVQKDLGGKSPTEFAHHPIGTGPFVLADWNRGESLTLEANLDYWNPKLPLLDKIVFNTVQSDTSRTLQLRGGQIDLIASPPLAQVSALESTPGITMGKFALAFPDYLMFNLRSPGPFSDPRMREAADLVIDRDAIVKAALSGVGVAGGSWYAPTLRFYDKSIKAPERDLEKAKALFDEAVADGVSPKVTLKTFNSEGYGTLAAQIIQANLEEIGMQVAVRPFDESALLEQISNFDYEAAVFGLTSDIIEPSEVTSFYIDLEGYWTGADTTRMEKLLAAAIAEPNPAERRDIYYEIQQMVAEQKEIIPLDYRYWLWAMQDDVAGFEVSATGVPWFANAGFTG